MPTPQSDVDPTAARQLIDEGAATLLDVREDDEWKAGHAPAAVHVPLGRLNPDDLTSDRTLVVVCRSGGRSSKAAAALAAAGLQVHNLAGGMQAWERVGLPVVRDDNEPGTVI